MAVEVVVPGQIPAEKRMGGKCAWCGCVVKCLQGDAKYNPETGGSYQDAPWYGVTCPTSGCGKQICLSFKVPTDDDLYVR